MADPLSIAASILAVLGAADQTGKALQKAWSLRHLDQEVVVLINAISGLRSHLRVVEISLRTISEEPLDNTLLHDCLIDVESLQAQASTVLSELDAVVQSILRKKDDRDEQLRLIASKRAWLRHKPALKKLRSQISTITASLSGAQTALNSILSVQHSRAIICITHAIQNISIVQQSSEIPNSISMTDNPQIEAQLETAAAQLAQISQLHKTSEGVQDNLSQSLIASSRRGSRGSFLSAHSIRPDPVSDFVSITTSLGVEQCKEFCPCQCHVHSQIRTPRWAKQFLGSILFHGNASVLLNRRPCNFRSCNRSGATSTQFTYMAPSWAFMRSFTFQARDESLYSSNASISIRTARVIPDTSPVWSFIELAKLDILKDMVMQQAISPYDVGPDGRSLLKYAAVKCRMEICRFLINLGADPFYRDTAGISAIQPGLDQIFSLTSVDRDLPDKEVLDINLFTNTEMLDEQDFTLLHRIVLGLCETDLESQVKLDPRHIDTPDGNGRTPLLWAAWRGDSRSVEILLKHQADPNEADFEGFTALSRAAKAGRLSCVESLLRARASVTPATFWGSQAIHFASGNKSHGVPIIKALLASGADINARGSGDTPLHEAANRGSLETVQYLVENGAELDAVNEMDLTPAMVALLCWNEDIFLCLAELGARLDLKTTDGLNFVQFVTWTASPRSWEVLIDAAQRGKLTGLNLMSIHAGHDIWHCFKVCRENWYLGDRGNRDEETAVFKRLIQAADVQ